MKTECLLNKNLLIVLMAVLCVVQITRSQEPQSFKLNGTIFSDLSWMQYTDQKSLSDFAGMSTLELRGRNTYRQYGTVSAQLDLFLLYGQYASAAGLALDSMPGSFEEKAPLVLNLRELYLALYPPLADISIGRQIIRFGRGTVLSPLDIFSTLNATDISFKRNGRDVVNVRIPLGMLSGIDLITELPHGQQHSSAAKFFTNLNGFDIDAVALYRHRPGDVSTGAAFKGDLYAGIYGEGVVHWRNSLRPQFEAMAGIDYSLFNRKVLLALEYSYNSAPIDPDTIPPEQIATLPRPFNRRHYLYLNAGSNINELLSVHGNLIFNIEDKAVQGILLLRYSLLQDISITPSIRGCRNDLNGIDLPNPDLVYSLRIEMAF